VCKKGDFLTKYQGAEALPYIVGHYNILCIYIYIYIYIALGIFRDVNARRFVKCNVYYNFPCCFVWVCNLVADIAVGNELEGV